MIRKITELTVHYLGHVLAVGVIVYFFYQVATYLYGISPTFGIDLYLSVTFISYIKEHLAFPFNVWFYPWYGGGPLTDYYPTLSFYLAIPVSYFVGIVRSIQVLSLTSLALTSIFSYFLFFEVSKNKVISAVLAIGVVFSFNIYYGWIWTGGQPYIITLFGLPLALFLVYKGLSSGKFNYVYLAALCLGIIVHIHPQTTFSYTIPYVLVLLAFYHGRHLKLFSLKKFQIVPLFVLIVYLVGFPVVYRLGGTTLSTFIQFFDIFKTGGETIARTQATTETGFAGSEATFMNKFAETWQRSNPVLLDLTLFLGALAIVFLLLQLVINRRLFISNIFKVFLIGVLLTYFYLFVYGFWLGINPLTGGWTRAFWVAPIILGFAAASFWSITGSLLEFVWETLISKKSQFIYLKYVTGILFSAFLIVLAVLFLGTSYIEKSKQDLFSEIEKTYEISSAYPTILSLKIEKDEWPGKLPKLVPDWINPDDLSYRLADLDATVNIWWSSVNKLPLSRGYLDAPISNANYSGWQYFSNISIWKDELVDRFDYSAERAKNVAFFFIDWFGIKYLEGAVGGGTTVNRNYGALPSSYVASESAIVKREEVNFKIDGDFAAKLKSKSRIHSDVAIEGLDYYEINNDLTSPVYLTTNSPSILTFGNPGSQDVLMRLFAASNLNSRRAVIVYGGQMLDEFSLEDLKNFDLVVLYQYDYKNSSKVWKNLLKYVEEGGKIFVDTGSDAKESMGGPLPEIFPIDLADRGPVFEDWKVEVASHSATVGIDFSKFAKPSLDGEDWNVSFSKGGTLRMDAKPILSVSGQPLVVEYPIGQGKVIWSGLNLPFYVLTINQEEEMKFFEKLIFYLEDFSKTNDFYSKFERPSPQEAIIFGKNEKGVIFKESFNKAWKAKVESNGKETKLRVYQAGPGLMYAAIPKEYRDDYKVTFEFTGNLGTKLAYLVSILTTFFLIDILLLNKILSAFLLKLLSPLSGKLGLWWEKEEEQ